MEEKIIAVHCSAPENLEQYNIGRIIDKDLLDTI
jgi:hypothetical protein